MFGATPIYYQGWILCCGWLLASYAIKESLKMASNHRKKAIEAGADCLVTLCSLYHLNLDS